MRWLALAGLAVLALAAGLWFLLLREPEAAVITDTPATAPEPARVPATAAPSREAQARSASGIANAVKKQLPPRAAEPSSPPPSLGESAAEAGSGKKPPTADDRFRYKLARAVHDTEPQVLECLEAAKKTGQIIDGASTFGSVISLDKDGNVVLESSSLEYGPYAAELNTCLMDTAKHLQLEALPGGVAKLHVFRKITVENGEIKNYQIPTYRPAE